MRESLVLLDLDGVVVFEVEPPFAATTELILLHENFDRELDALGIPVVVLTHRSRREARHILQVAGVATTALAGVIAAEDLFMAGVCHAPARMLKRGLRKDLALTALERRFGIDRSQIAFIDDRVDNLRDLVAAGIGLAIHAPSYLNLDQRLLMAFHIGDAFASIRSWDRSKPHARIISLPPQPLTMSRWRRTGLSTAPHGRHVFNAARRWGGIVRLALQGRGP
jgi:hypothetical protein